MPPTKRLPFFSPQKEGGDPPPTSSIADSVTPVPAEKKQRTGEPKDDRECTWTPEQYDYRYSFEKQTPPEWNFCLPEEKAATVPTGSNRKYGMPGLFDLMSKVGSEDLMAKYLSEEYDVLNIPTHCPCCKQPIKPPKNGIVRCISKPCRSTGEWSKSIYRGTFFEGAAASKGRWKVLVFLWLWVMGASSALIELATGWCADTVYNWTNSIQDLITMVVLRDNVQIGGPGVVVEIDESKFGKRKHHKGHRVEGAWVFGGVELTPERKFFAVVVPDRTKKTLLPIIKRHILPGTIIRSDCFASYVDHKSGDIRFYPESCHNLADWMPEMNYTHELVNHERSYVDKRTGIHTNTIEGTWYAVKRWVPVRKRTKKQLQGCLFEFIWRRYNEGNLWNGLMRVLRDIRYQPKGYGSP